MKRKYMSHEDRLRLIELTRDVYDYSFDRDIFKSFEDMFPKHFQGENPDGTRYSYWKIGNVITGDGGMELINKALKEQTWIRK